LTFFIKKNLNFGIVDPKFVEIYNTNILQIFVLFWALVAGGHKYLDVQDSGWPEQPSV
jgi:hypothetical protein